MSTQILNLPKVTVGCRMSPEMREELEKEAFESDMTLSSYIEAMLGFRVRAPSIYEDYDALVDDYNALIDQYNELAEEDTSESEVENRLPWLTPTGESRMELLLQKLTALFPDQNRKNLLVAALEVTLMNAQSKFHLYDLVDYFARPGLAGKLEL